MHQAPAVAGDGGRCRDGAAPSSDSSGLGPIARALGALTTHNRQYCYIHNIVNVHTTFNDDTMNSNTAAILIETKKELKKQDKLENIERRKRIDEFIRLQTLQKIASDDARTARIKKTKLQDQKIKPTDFHLLVDHLHHKPDARHPMLHAPNIRLGKSRPTRKPRNKTGAILWQHQTFWFSGFRLAQYPSLAVRS